MDLLNNALYIEDLNYVAGLDLPWDKLKDSSMLITGATGLIGRFLVDVLAYKNRDDLNCKVYCVGRNANKAKGVFGKYFGEPWFSFVECDVSTPDFAKLLPSKCDYVFHAASNTHPLAYSTDPIGTITANVFATYGLLDYCSNIGAKRFVLSSSNEVYGENRGDVEFFDEDYCGYINCNSLRAGYPESKRCSEALCQAFITQKSVDSVIVRFTRSYGPTLLKSDTKALSQFLRCGLKGDDVVLKSKGEQYYSFSYVADSVAGFLYVLLKGETGLAYNVADKKGDGRLKDVAECIANYAKTSVVYDIPDEVERRGYSTATKARLDGRKVKPLGWSMKYDINDGIRRSLDIMRDCSSL